MSFMCSANESGTPGGASGSSRTSPLALYSSMRSIRCSTSRTFWRYRSSRRRSSAPSSSLEHADLAHDPVEDALIGATADRPLGAAATRAEQQVERRPGILDHGQGLVRRGPAHRVRVRAVVVVPAPTRLIEPLDAELQRRQCRVRPEALREELVDRGPAVDVRALCLLGVRLAQEDRRGAEVVTADLLGAEGFRHPHVGVADDRGVVLPLPKRDRGRWTGRACSPSRPAGANIPCSCAHVLHPAAPWTSSMQTSRVLSSSCRTRAARRPAGTIASRNGSAIVAPIPRSMVRRDMCLPVRYMWPSSIVSSVRVSSPGRCLLVARRKPASSRKGTLSTTPMMKEEIR